MSITQTVAKKILPKSWAKSMETESRRWMLHCPNCDAEQSIWDLGGIRWKARSIGKAIYKTCPICYQRGWMKMLYRDDAAHVN